MSDDRDLVVSGFASQMQGAMITEERAEEICRAVEILPFPRPTRQAICGEVREHIVRNPRVSITAEHARYLAELVAWFRRNEPQRKLDTAYTDELLEDLSPKARYH